MKKKYFVIVFYFVLYLILFFTTYSANYIEGDDASTILYHLCGRNKVIQMPYSCYNSGFDFLLSFFGENEIVLRNFSIFISFVFGLIVLVFLAILVSTLFENDNSNKKYFFLALLPFLIPDFIFQSLIVNSCNISFALLLLSTIFYVKFIKKHNNIFLILSIFFAAIAIPFRWSNLTYYPVFFSILIFACDFERKKIIHQIKPLVFHFCVSIFLGIFFIYISGYNLTSLIETFFWGKKVMENNEKSIAASFAIGSSFVTIPFVILMFFGFIKFFRNSKKQVLEKIIFLFIPIFPYLILGIFIAFKYLITVIPILVIISYYGFTDIHNKKFQSSLLYSSILAMWFIGIKIDLNNTLCGDGYGFKKEIRKQKNTITEKNLDARLKFDKIKLSLDGGLYMPTAEGPRPLFGYFYVIFGGLWKKDLENLAAKRATIIQKLKINNDVILLQDRMTAYLECELYKNGYQTFDTYLPKKNTNLLTRNYFSKTDTIVINVISDNVSKSEFSIDFLNKNKNVIFRSSYSSLIFNVLNQELKVDYLDAYTVYKK